MKKCYCDWKYVTAERAQMNVAIIASKVINDLAKDDATEQIIGVCALMNAIMESLEADGEDQ